MTTIWHYQSAQLAVLNWQIANQQQHAAWQANLHQALHETEQMARRVEATRSQDAFAAGVLSATWLRRMHGLTSGHYNDVNAKRAWQSAYDTLDGAARSARSNDANKLDTYLRLSETLNGFHQRLGQDPQSIVMRAHADAAKWPGLVWAVFCAPILLTMLVMALAIGDPKARGAAIFVEICLAIAAGFLLMNFYKKGWAPRRALQARANAISADAQSFERFKADPNGGQWLQNVWREHKLIFDVAIPDPKAETSPTSSRTYVERSTVERQIVVTRCKYCQKLSPVDRPTCEHCGAAGFGSSVG